MKKTYFAPKSETLMAILREICDNITIDPAVTETGSAGPMGAPRFNGAPAAGHSL